MMKSIKRVAVSMIALGIGFGIVMPAVAAAEVPSAVSTVAAPGNDFGYDDGIGDRFNDRAEQRRQNDDDRDDRRARQERYDQALAARCAQNANVNTVECQRYFQRN